MELNKLIDVMKQLAHKHHAGQYRKDGKTPYISHVERVASSVEDRLKPIAYGHDLVEDTDITIQQLVDLGIPAYVTDAIDLLTHKNGESNIDYWNKIFTNKDALAVKVADVNDNISDNPSDRARKKYNQFLDSLKAKSLL